MSTFCSFPIVLNLLTRCLVLRALFQDVDVELKISFSVAFVRLLITINSMWNIKLFIDSFMNSTKRVAE